MAGAGLSSFSGEVHPAAAVFPMLPDDELAELAASIGADGLDDPIVLDRAGRLLDGRNRVAACALAGVEPTFVTFDGDDDAAVGYVLRHAVLRRNVSASQRAMGYVLVGRTALGGRADTSREEAAREAHVGDRLIKSARFVARHAPDLCPKVMAGEWSVERAHDEAKRRRDIEQRRDADLAALRASTPDLHAEVVAGKQDVAEAMTRRHARLNEATSTMGRHARVLDDLARADQLLAGDPEVFELAYREHIPVPTADVDKIGRTVIAALAAFDRARTEGRNSSA
jgi:ParB-like chromosome segregation protein Spo0J